MKVNIVIPAYNEEDTIARTIEKCRPYADKILVVCSNKSKDRTTDFARKSGVEVILDHGLGKGDALITAINHIDEGILLFFDADGSHIPEDIPKVVNKLEAEAAIMCIASRVRGGSLDTIEHSAFESFLRNLFCDIITFIINLRFGLRLTESQNGFRAIRAREAKLLNLQSKHTEIETEMCLKCAKMKFKMVEVPSTELARRAGKSSVNIIKHGPNYIWTLLKYVW